jgi:hypothetical protein
MKILSRLLDMKILFCLLGLTIAEKSSLYIGKGLVVVCVLVLLCVFYWLSYKIQNMDSTVLV